MNAVQSVLQATFARLQTIYREQNLKPGVLSKIGLKQGWNAIIGTEGQCGVAMNFTGWEQVFGKPVVDAELLRTFVGCDLFQVAQYHLARNSWQEKAIGVAALNALSQPLLAPLSLRSRGIQVPSGAPDFASLVKPEDIVAVVGYGGGARRLLGKGKEIHFTDMRPRSAFQTLLIGKEIAYSPEGVFIHSEKENEEVLRRASLVSITGSTLVNGTFERLVSYATNARIISVYGPSASILPDALFERGVHMIHTFRITDPVAFENGVVNEMNMEGTIHGTQESLTMSRIVI